MSIAKNLTHRVLRKVLADKSDIELPEDQKGKEDAPGTIEGPLKSPVQPVKLQVVKRIYFFSAPEGKDISFYSLYSILSGSAEGVDNKDQRELIENLKGGSAPYAGDHFEWIAMAALCEDPSDTKKKASYMYLLNSWGTYDSSRTRMAKTRQSDFEIPNADEAAKQFNFFKTVQALSGAINNMIDIAVGPGTFFSTSIPSEDLVDKMLIAKPEDLIESIRSDFNIETFNSQYRIRVLGVSKTGTELRNIDGTLSEKDELGPKKFGNYAGGEKAFQELMEVSNYNPEKKQDLENPEEKGAPEKSLGEQIDKGAPEKSLGEQIDKEEKYRPVDEVKPTTKETQKERFINAVYEKGSFIKEINEEDPNVNQYEGDWSIMQDLVRRQQKKMKIRKRAAGTIDLQVPAEPEPTEEVGKALQELSESLKVVEDTTKDIQRSTGVKIQTVPKMGNRMASMVDQVLSKYLDI